MKKEDAEFAAAARENIPILIRLCLNLDHEVITLQGERSVLKHKLMKAEDENELLKTIVRNLRVEFYGDTKTDRHG